MPQDLTIFFQAARNHDYVILSLIMLIWFFEMLYLILFRFRLVFHKAPPSGVPVCPVSVIMIERNEEDNLAKNLPGWLSLGYPEYEVLVVDDFSEDNSLTVLGLLRQNNPRLKMTGLNQETRYSQKLSRNLALKAANFDYAVFVHPAMDTPDDHWLPGIAAAFYNHADIAVGYIRLKPFKGWYHKLYRIESFSQQTESMSYCLIGLPYVSTEENIAFRKQLYFDINGFAGKIAEENLNMEMIYNEVIRRKNHRLMVAGNLTLVKEVIAGKSDYYDLLHKDFILKKRFGLKIRLTSGFFGFVRILYFPAIITGSLLYLQLWPEFLILLLISAILGLTGLKRLQNRFNERGMFLSSLLYSALFPYIRLFINWRYNFKRKNP